MTNQIFKWDVLVANIKIATDLWDLLAALQAFERASFADEDEGNLWAYENGAPINHHNIDNESALSAYGVDLHALKTFGGKEPKNTEGLWSWDENTLLVGDGLFRDWTLVDRDDESQAWRA